MTPKPLPVINHKKRSELANKGHRKTPSQLRSERDRKRLLRGHAPPKPPEYDCFDCPKACGLSGPNHCNEKALLGQCSQCGAKVMYRVNENKKWDLCPSCMERRR